MQYYSTPQQALWAGRSDPGYWYQEIQQLSLTDFGPNTDAEHKFALLGYACEEGVRRNQGRLGAKEGPFALRAQLARTAWHLGDIAIFDSGDFVCENGQMEACQAAYSEGIAKLLEQSYLPIGIGGGHDIAFGTYQGVRKHLPKNKRLGIINFDAHFDLRKPVDLTHSGTPFFQAYKRQQSLGLDFDYLVLGIQRAANTRTLFETAHKTATQFILNEEMWRGARIESVKQFIEPLDAIYLSIDIDVFASPYAPGVSAVSPMGISPSECMSYLAPILKSGKVVAIDFAELSPPNDQQSQTAKLAARLLNWILQTISR